MKVVSFQCSSTGTNFAWAASVGSSSVELVLFNKRSEWMTVSNGKKSTFSVLGNDSHSNRRDFNLARRTDDWTVERWWIPRDISQSGQREQTSFFRSIRTRHLFATQLLEPFCLSLQSHERARAFDILNQLIQSNAIDRLKEQVPFLI